ncbi:glycosyltransferase family protein [Tichowtungia aerotolerans]|uniref:Glycosyltransferase family 1 protein n=1 Tax=Tichowtungia aerotolerans TaxID=2697043 RepID=A0A6P1MA10_9BACT|nr:hypothetical protein [Tichowtungia aerotolerans]QHI70671.1 hypothetical protein GT409_14895 [Tichowtungia aerotolerans]
MKIAILGNLTPGYICPMTQGLERMLRELRAHPTVFPLSLNLLSHSAGIKGSLKHIFFRPYMSRLAEFDAIIVVQHLRDAFTTALAIETLRLLVPDTPVLLYDLTYLPTVGRWGPWLKSAGNELWGSGSQTFRGLKRYDWYLCVSKQNRLPMPAEEQPCSEIGIYLDDDSLYPAPKSSFRALIDFEREAFPGERKLQFEALKETDTDYVVLQGQYPISAIREIYRTCSIYFLAHMESFGLPICELQACGSRIMTPYADWCDAHRLPDASLGSHHRLPPNFVIYDNHKETLIHEIQRVKEKADPKAVAESFRRHHGHFLTGNPDALQDVLDRISRKEITAQSHQEYTGRTEQIPIRPDNTNKHQQ